jgi:transcription elongation factor GreA
VLLPFFCWGEEKIARTTSRLVTIDDRFPISLPGQSKEETMSIQKRPITFQGHKKLTEDLDRMLRVERPSVIKEIEVALGHGDLSENAEYTYAKEKQALIETRIRDLQERISACEIIDLSNRPTPDRIVFGCSVKIEDLDTGDRKVYRLLGQDETDIDRGIISVISPLGKALIGKEVDDVVEVKTPNGLREYEVVEIS